MSYLDITNGRCYELSYNEVLHGTLFGEDPDITLVHGTAYHPAHEVYDHAWVVSGDGTVHDMVIGKTWPSREAHEADTGIMGQAKYLRTYTRMEAIQNASLVYRHCGPWDEAHPPLPEDDYDDDDDEDYVDAYGRRWGTCNECMCPDDEEVLIVAGLCQWCDEGEWGYIPWTDRTEEEVSA